MRANTFMLAGDMPNALQSADESVELEPDRLDSRDLRATLLVRSGRYSDAIAAYKDIETRFGITLLLVSKMAARYRVRQFSLRREGEFWGFMGHLRDSDTYRLPPARQIGRQSFV